MDRICEVIRDPLSDASMSSALGPVKGTPPRSNAQHTGGRAKLSLGLQNALGDHLRSVPPPKIIDQIVTSTESAVLHWKIPKALLNHEAIRRYKTTIAQITWTMANQRPAMEFCCPGVGEAFKELIQEPYWGSDDPASPLSRVQQYVLPVMYHGDSVMVKGKVIIKYPRM